MLLQVITLLLVATLSQTLFAALDFKSCSKAGLKIVYVNGILTTSDDAINSAARLRSVLTVGRENSALDVKEVSVATAYNPSYAKVTGEFQTPEGTVALTLDLAEAYRKKIVEITSRNDAMFLSNMYISLGGERLDQYLGENISSQLSAWTENIKFRLSNISQHEREAYNGLQQRTFEGFQAQKKVIHVAHSQGAFFAANLAKQIVNGNLGFEEYKGLYGAVFLGAAINYLPTSVESKKFSYLSAQQDAVAVGLSSIGLALEPNVSVPSVPVFSIAGHSIDDTYFGSHTGHYAGRSRQMKEHLFELLKGVVSTLDNNDLACCNGRDGKLNLNKADCEHGVERCLGGFVESGVIASDESIHVARGVQVCRTDPNARPVISGKVSIESDVGLGKGSFLKGPRGGLSQLRVGSVGGTVYLRDNAGVYQNGGESLNLLGDLMISNAEVRGEGTIRGESHSRMPSRFVSSISDTKINGTVDVKGAFVIASDVAGSHIAGSFVTPLYTQSTTIWNFLGIWDATIDPGATITGMGSFYQGAHIGTGVTLVGSARQDNIYGIHVFNSRVLGQGTRLEGSVLVGDNSLIADGAQLNGNIGVSLAPSIGVAASQVSGGQLLGRGVLNISTAKDSTLRGCQWGYAGATITNSSLHGYFLYQSGAIISGVTREPEPGSEEFYCGIPLRQKMYKVPRYFENVARYMALREKFPIPNYCQVFGCPASRSEK